MAQKIPDLKDIEERKSIAWKTEQEKRLLELFKQSSSSISAYKDFIKKAGIQPDAIKTIADFAIVPSVDKNNYLRAYPWKDLCSPDIFTAESLVLTSTSGSTGSPFYFPRTNSIDEQSSIYHELFIKSSGLDPKKSTLVLVCFGMGVWIGGVITYQAFKKISERGHPMTILTPGVNKKEIFEAMKNVAPNYDQIVMCGYPPFMKDLIDEGKANGVNWKDHDIRMSFAAESFSEKFRDYMIQKTGMENPYRSTMSVYGSADIGTMAEETPICILIRRLALKNKKLYRRVFNEATRLPTLAQYIPSFIQFEEVGGRIFLSGKNALPLVRYEIGDNGGTHYFHDIEKIFAEEDVDLRAEAKKAGILDTVLELPFVYIYERTDLSTKLYGAIIYPEYIKHGLLNHVLEDCVTGKFTMFTKHDKKQDEYLEINVELKPGILATEELEKKVSGLLNESLMEKSAEHKNNVNMMPGKVEPHVVFWSHEDPLHFQVGIKQKWVKKQ